MTRRGRERRPGRRPPFREPRPTILIVCEGDITEPEYFQGLRRAFRNQLVEIRIAAEHGVPKTLVNVARDYKRGAEKQARRARDENIAFDSVWCVFDVDDHPNIGDAREMARDNGIQLAISNPCFELWLLLHFRDNPGMQDRGTITKMLCKFVPGYDKHVDFETYSTGYLNATTRAAQMDRSAELDDDAGRNPTTNVYCLTEIIRGSG